MKLTAVLLSGSLAAGAPVSTAVAQQMRTNEAPPVTLPNTHTHLLHSRVNGRTYRIDVALPSDYVDTHSDRTTRYPALYLLDGEWDLKLLFAQMQFAAMLRPTTTVLVGVTAADSQEQRREFDYTPPLNAADSAYFREKFSSSPSVGGAPQFLRVLKEEIIPLIDRTYRTSGDRGIEGTSFGGLFVAYAMFEEPGLFSRYAMISPSLWYPWGREKGVMLASEPEFAKRHPTFAKTIYVSVGSEEGPGMIAVAWQFVSQLCSSIGNGYYRGLDLGAETLAGQSHGSTAARVRALAALYPADSTATKPGRRVMQDCH